MNKEGSRVNGVSSGGKLSRLVLLSLVNFINIYKKNCIFSTISQFYRQIDQNTEFLQRYFDNNSVNRPNSVKTDPVCDPVMG